MTRWIRGRLGRPIASILFGLMLVSFLLPLAPPRAQAQSLANLAKLFEESTPKTPIAVVDFDNQSKHRTGMLGRTMADAMSMELMQTGTFDIVTREKVEKMMTELHLSVPLNWSQQALLASRLCSKPPAMKYNVNFTVSGIINNVEIHKATEGTVAVVAVRVVIISRVTGMPINGVDIVQSSSPKIGYSGNYDSLIAEALTTASFQAVMKIMDSRVPIGTILTSPRNGEIVMKGGAALGFRIGMECTTLRRDNMTGRIRLSEVTPNESSGIVLEDSSGISPGDKILPIFEFARNSRRITKGAVGEAGLYVAAIAAGSILFSLIGTNNNNNRLTNFTAGNATALADAQDLNFPSGANILRWPTPSKRVVAYIIYRDTYPDVSPIAVIDGSQNFYIDNTNPIPQTSGTGSGTTGGVMEESITYTITFTDPATGLVTWTIATVYDTTVNIGNPTETFSQDSYTVTTHRVPLTPGEKTGYQIKVLYMDYMENGLGGANGGGGSSVPQEYSFYLGNKGTDSNRVTCVQPPTLTAPAPGQPPTNGTFSCGTVPKALNYVLYYSTDNIHFSQDTAAHTNISPNTINIIDQNYQQNMIDYKTKLSIAQLSTNENIYWRIGAKVDGESDPTVATPSDVAENGYVFSSQEVFNYSPPSTPLARRHAKGHGKLPPANKGGVMKRY